MTIRDQVITHAAVCRKALAAGQPCHTWQGGDLTGANLAGANLTGANLRAANLSGADLSGADLRDANLYGANLRAANLYGANLYDADLYGADLTGAYLTGAKIAEGTVTSAAYGSAGGYRWHALRTEGGVTLQYGCDRAPLAEWRKRDQAYGARHGHDAAHWAAGPAVAIAAAEALLT